jgi:hypothetical protein
MDSEWKSQGLFAGSILAFTEGTEKNYRKQTKFTI